jgi:excisionase family DNA binding protein
MKENRTELTKLAYRVTEIAELTGTSVPFIRKQIANKQLSARKLGDAVVILRADLEKWLNAATGVA